jgi:hypothetical protein
MCTKTPSAMLLSLLLLAASEPRSLTLSPVLDLQLDAPSECSHTIEVVAAVDGLVHTVPAEPLEVRAKISSDSRGYALHAAFGAGMREVHGDSCEAVTQALIAITALAIDPSVRLSVAAFPELSATDIGQPVEGAPAPGQAERTVATDSGIFLSQAPANRLRSDSAADSRPLASEKKERALVIGASLLGLGEWGALPEPSYGASGLLRASLGAWGGELGASWLRPRWVQVEQGSTDPCGSQGRAGRGRDCAGDHCGRGFVARGGWYRDLAGGEGPDRGEDRGVAVRGRRARRCRVFGGVGGGLRA